VSSGTLNLAQPTLFNILRSINIFTKSLNIYLPIIVSCIVLPNHTAWLLRHTCVNNQQADSIPIRHTPLFPSHHMVLYTLWLKNGPLLHFQITPTTLAQYQQILVFNQYLAALVTL